MSFNDFPSIRESIGNITRMIEDLEYKIIMDQNKDGVRGSNGYYRIDSVKDDTINLKSSQSSCVTLTIKISLDLSFDSDKIWEEAMDEKYGSPESVKLVVL